jgi:hypothetical protein
VRDRRLEAFERLAHRIENKAGAGAVCDRHFGNGHHVTGFHGLREEARGEDVAQLVRVRRRLVGGVLGFFRGAGAEKKDGAFVLDGIREQGGNLNPWRRLSFLHRRRPGLESV